MQLHRRFLPRFGSLVLSLCALVFSPLQSSAQIATGKPKFIGSVIPGSVPASFSTYWNQVTPENSGKWGSVESTRNVMNWSGLDLAYNFAQRNGYKFKEHTLVWGSQFPGWITSLSPAEQRAEVVQWIQAFAQRYPDTWAVDVVNEPIKTPLPFKEALGGDGVTGWDWVIFAFQTARQALPNAKLLINEFGTENDPPVRAQYLTIINLLKARGLIDGIGVQSHYFNLDFMTASQLTTTLNDYAATGLDIFISELDIRGGSTPAGQAAKYQELFPVIWNHPSVKGITLWGYIEGQTWRPDTGIVTSSGVEKPAMTWLKGFVTGNTNTTTLTVSAPSVAFTASGGSSPVTVTSNVAWTVAANQTWISLNPTSSSNNGMITITAAANTGAARSGVVTVSGGGLSRVIAVSQAAGGVINVPVTGVRVAPTAVSLQVGATATLTATVLPANATNRVITWSSSAPTIATVNASGVVVGVGPGSATITVRTQDGGFTASSTVIVPDPNDFPPCVIGGQPRTVPFVQNGAGEFCFVTSGNISFINSWNMQLVEINGVVFTNRWANTLPPRINGSYYIHYVANVPWAHLEVN